MSAPFPLALARASMVLTMLAAGSGCASSSDGGGPANDTGALVNGTPATTASFPATVYIGNDCTAAKVGPRLLLTAAHCVLDPATVDLRYPAGSKISVTRDPSQAHREIDDLEVASVNVHPAWIKACQDAYCAASSATARLDAADVAVIELAADLDGVPVASVDATPLVTGDHVTVIGFGCTVGVLVPDSREKVTLASAESQIIDASRAVHDGSAVRPSDVAQVAGIYALTPGPGASKSNVGLCPGDSGGPLYKSRDGALVVVGVNSNYTLGPDESDQVGLPITNWHTRLDEHSRHAVAAWLRSVGVSTLPVAAPPPAAPTKA